jgi:hypothetical protein
MKKSFLIYLFFLLFLFHFSCRKSGGEHSYRSHLSAAHNMVLVEHTLVQIAATYIKSIHDSVLIADGYAKVDEAHAYLKIEDEILSIEIRYDEWGVPDPYKRYRKGTITAELTDTIPMLYVETALNFDSFSLDDQSILFEKFAITKLSQSASMDTYKLEVAGGSLTSENNELDILFESIMEISLHHSTDQQYFKPGDWFSATAVSNARTAFHFEVESATQDAFELKEGCSYFSEGNSLIRFGNLTPDSGYYTFGGSADTCSPYFLLDLSDMVLYQSIDWMIFNPVTPEK